MFENIRNVRTGIVRKDSYPGVPEWIFHELKAYVLDGHPTGTFLESVISNDLCNSIARADDEGVVALKPLVMMLYNDCPGSCWKSPAAYERWLKIGCVVQWVGLRTGYRKGLELNYGVMGYWLLALAQSGDEFDQVVALVDAPTSDEARDAVTSMFGSCEVYSCVEHSDDWRPAPEAFPMP